MRVAWIVVFALACRKAPLEFTDDVDGDGFGINEDCNDEDAAVFPGAVELCDGIDNNCSGNIDDDAQDALTYYPDDDGDGFGIDRGAELVCDAPEGFVTENGDCNDQDLTIYPGAPEICDNRDNDCDGIVQDDGTAPWFPDSDGDGIGAIGVALDACEPPEGFVSVTGDCNDNDLNVLPNATEVCDDVDNNCDGAVDEGLTSTFYADGDADGFGSQVTTEACDLPDGFSETGGDCNDSSALAFPGGDEVCDSLDNNCDGTVDEGLTQVFWSDNDGDGFGSDVSTVACFLPEGFAQQTGDCDDDAANAFPGGEEVCDSLDNNCDGNTDEGFEDTNEDGVLDCLEEDLDNDGFTPAEGDCDDTNADIYEGAIELCDGLDNDCDGVVPDVERDGDSDGFTECEDDCDDSNDMVGPNALELCDGLDNDCDGVLGDDEVDNDDDGVLACDDSCDDDPDISTGACEEPLSDDNPHIAGGCNCDALTDRSAQRAAADAARRLVAPSSPLGRLNDAPRRSTYPGNAVSRVNVTRCALRRSTSPMPRAAAGVVTPGSPSPSPAAKPRAVSASMQAVAPYPGS